MNNIYFTVGPSQMYPTLENHLHEAIEEEILSLNHRGPVFQKMYEETEQLLKQLLHIPEDYVLFFLGSSIEAMERIIENTVAKASFHFVDGAFSQKAESIARELQKKTITEVAPEQSDYDFTSLTIPEEAELIFITDNDTSTGLIFPHEEIAALKKRYPEKLIAVDLVSSAPYSSIDFSTIDMGFFSGQKGFGIPAGLSMLVVSPQALAKAEHLKEIGKNIGSFHSFPSLHKSREQWMNPETPNVLAIYLFQKILRDMLEKGIDTIRQEIDEKAKLLYDFFDSQKGYRPLITDKAFRSPSTLVIEVEGGNTALLSRLKQNGIIIGSGYGEQKERHIRIANFPAHTGEQVESLIDLFRHSGDER